MLNNIDKKNRNLLELNVQKVYCNKTLMTKMQQLLQHKAC